jgi:hypothetical protein
MKSNTIPPQLPMAMEEVCTLSVESWRLVRIAALLKDRNEGPGLRYAVRRITEILKGMGIEVVDLAGRSYDSGMVPEVVEVREDQDLSDGPAVIDETVAPTVIWRGQVIAPGQIIVRRAPVKPEE